MEGCQKDGGGGDFGIVPGIGQAGGGAETEYLIEIASKRREFMRPRILLSHNCKIGGTSFASISAPLIYPFRLRLRCCARSRRSNSRLMSEIFSSRSFSLW